MRVNVLLKGTALFLICWEWKTVSDFSVILNIIPYIFTILHDDFDGFDFHLRDNIYYFAYNYSIIIIIFDYDNIIRV